jgi:uncharacterized protein (TIGR02145 family)
MKKTTTFICMMLAILEIQAQDYLITFAGAGDTSAVSTIIVNNLTSGATVTLNGGDILHLSSTLGIENLDFENKKLKISPNPMSYQSMLTFAASETGNTVISIVDLSGRFVCKVNANLTIGTHTFRISGISQGLYFVNVTGKAYNYTTKLVSQGNLQGEESIEYISSVTPSTSNPLKSTSATIDMLYNSGDQLLYKGISGIYSTIVTDVPTSSKTTTFNFVACTDNDNNNYPTVQIGMGKSGTQTWMAENLRTTKYRSGTPIEFPETDNFAWQNNTTGAYAWYGNDISYKDIYGALYNWHAVNNANGLCPSGWYVPSDEEWKILEGTVDSQFGVGHAEWDANDLRGHDVGKMLKSTTGWLDNGNGTDDYGFSALAGGYRFDNGNFFLGDGYAGAWWGTTESTAGTAWARWLLRDSDKAYRLYSGTKEIGFSVRCVKD